MISLSHYILTSRGGAGEATDTALGVEDLRYRAASLTTSGSHDWIAATSEEKRDSSAIVTSSSAGWYDNTSWRKS